MKGISTQLIENFKAEGYHITRAHWLIMAKTYHFKDDCFLQSEAVEMLMGDKTAVTRAVDDLVKRGWLIQEIDKQDRRNRVLKLTAKGEATVPVLLKTVNKTIAEMTAGIEENEMAITKSVLAKIIANTHKYN